MRSHAHPLPATLLTEVATQCERGVPPGLEPLIEKVRIRFGDSLLAILLYGSCLRMQQLNEGVVDLYVVVSNYRNAYTESSLRCLNSWLPPNVFYIEAGDTTTPIRAKYAVISEPDLQRGCTRWFHSYIWARFAQPSRLVYARDATVRARLYQNFAQAVLRFLQTTLPALGNTVCDSATLWENALSLTYAAELRPERHNRAQEITRQNIDDFTRLTVAAVPALAVLVENLPAGRYRVSADPAARSKTLRQWRVRRWQGMLLSVLRLTKAAFTFRDCLDYAAWKIERHTGIHIEVTPRMQRHPVLFGFSVLWRLIKRDVMH